MSKNIFYLNNADTNYVAELIEEYNNKLNSHYYIKHTKEILEKFINQFKTKNLTYNIKKGQVILNNKCISYFSNSEDIPKYNLNNKEDIEDIIIWHFGCWINNEVSKYLRK